MLVPGHPSSPPPPSPEGNVRPGVFFCLLRTATEDISGPQDTFMFFDRFNVFY